MVHSDIGGWKGCSQNSEPLRIKVSPPPGMGLETSQAMVWTFPYNKQLVLSSRIYETYKYVTSGIKSPTLNLGGTVRGVGGDTESVSTWGDDIVWG